MMQTTTFANTTVHPMPKSGRYLPVMLIGGIIVTTMLAPWLAWPALLVVSQYLLGLALGSMFFLAIQNLSHAKWSRSIEFVPRALAGLLPWVILILLPVLTLGMGTLYDWSHAHAAVDEEHGAHAVHGAHAPLSGFKAAWLSPGFFWLRSAVYLVLWLAFARAFAKAPVSAHQNSHEARPMRLSAVFVAVFGVTCVTSSVDWIMSLDAHWFSTIFGVYNFAGMFVSTLAAMTIIVILLQRAGRVAGRVSPALLHDLGRLIFAFSCFWAYIWFSQYMLIWYSNLPEETGFYALRHTGIWQVLSFLVVVCNWGVPFVALLSATAKRNESTLLIVCSLLLIGRALDLAVMILPPLAHGSPFAAVAMLALAAVVLVTLILFLRNRLLQLRAISGPH